MTDKIRIISDQKINKLELENNKNNEDEFIKTKKLKKSKNEFDINQVEWDDLNNVNKNKILIT